MTNALGRADFDVIASWVAPGHRVLDLGCGNGALLRHLIDSRQVVGWGVEIDKSDVLAAIRNGISVIQSNLEDGLRDFADQSFDHVVLSRTLQTVRHTEDILREMLRVGREAVVSFPNFAYWKNLRSVLNGRMPVSEDLPYQWYNSPNVRFFTLLDFEALCEQMALTVVERQVLDEEGQVVDADSARDLNFLGSLAVYRLTRNS
ncbi:methionine biosynthesis protein MetW [Azonexus hydrophilus]|jgi:methionine biosynthesis protein MetW|uniref:methionine biosynthesis protein MetW n=1 Tax=Azonexus hydrophilus TaxID=418702 RepID=UPI0017535620|nr:methionine biosynthesis protein MetW [Azonexus hydrophilus]MBP8022392.1 methionine biosynthesis protein MetW [Azonexus sp.]MDX9737379.1 methionine biosynthesis protein MetW [Azonexus sp.]HHV48166.1 methionine biosynthesis protein MetW [Rhodocyclaceae bacterium]